MAAAHAALAHTPSSSSKKQPNKQFVLEVSQEWHPAAVSKSADRQNAHPRKAHCILYWFHTAVCNNTSLCPLPSNACNHKRQTYAKDIRAWFYALQKYYYRSLARAWNCEVGAPQRATLLQIDNP
jgi:hypothetical protein